MSGLMMMRRRKGRGEEGEKDLRRSGRRRENQ